MRRNIAWVMLAVLVAGLVVWGFAEISEAATAARSIVQREAQELLDILHAWPVVLAKKDSLVGAVLMEYRQNPSDPSEYGVVIKAQNANQNNWEDVVLARELRLNAPEDLSRGFNWGRAQPYFYGVTPIDGDGRIWLRAGVGEIPTMETSLENGRVHISIFFPTIFGRTSQIKHVYADFNRPLFGP